VIATLETSSSPSGGLTTQLFRQVDAASLAVFRIIFGLAVAIDAWRYLAYGWVRAYYVTPKIHFTYLYFDFVQPWPGDWMLVHFWAISMLALLVAAGLFYRVTSPLLFVTYTYVFLLEQSVYMNHHYLMALLALLLACMPADKAYAWKWPQARSVPRNGFARHSSVPLWTVWILRFQLVVVYAYGAIAKLNYDWLRGEPVYWGLKNLPGTGAAIARAVSPELVAYVITYGGIVADAAIPLLLVRRRTFWVGFAIAAAFHAFNAAFLQIGVFSYLMTGAILIFLPPDWPRRVARLGHTHAADSFSIRVRAVLAGLTAAEPAAPGAEQGLGDRRRGTVVALLACYVIVQLTIPLRHLLYPGPVSWTEEGHRFAWHMKLRMKHSVIEITATDKATGRSWIIDPRQDLTARQRRKLETFPDILLQYVHVVRDRLRQEGVDARITVDWRCSLNGRPQQMLVDPTVDLAAVERSVWPAKWILPLRTDG
jgi:hypothetical protein